MNNFLGKKNINSSVMFVVACRVVHRNSTTSPHAINS